MNLEELKQDIERQTGVPASLLNGETVEENIAQAKALIAYKREADAQRPKTTAEQFSDWMNARSGVEQPDTVGQALAQIEERARVEAGGYPRVIDSGEVANMPDMRSPKEQFADWLNNSNHLKYDPFKRSDGWRPLF